MKKTVFAFMLTAGLCAYANNKSSNNNDIVIQHPVIKKYKLNHRDSVAIESLSWPQRSPKADIATAD